LKTARTREGYTQGEPKFKAQSVSRFNHFSQINAVKTGGFALLKAAIT